MSVVVFSTFYLQIENAFTFTDEPRTCSGTFSTLNQNFYLIFFTFTGKWNKIYQMKSEINERRDEDSTFLIHIISTQFVFSSLKWDVNSFLLALTLDLKKRVKRFCHYYDNNYSILLRPEIKSNLFLYSDGTCFNHKQLFVRLELGYLFFSSLLWSEWIIVRRCGGAPSNSHRKV